MSQETGDPSERELLAKLGLDPDERGEIDPGQRALLEQVWANNRPTSESVDPRLDEVTRVDGHPLYYDRGGKPLTLRQWSQLHGDTTYRFLARDDVGDYEVVTAWLGIDQELGETPPAIFGTIAHRRGTDTWTGERFAASEEEALAQHSTLLRELQSGTLGRSDENAGNDSAS